MFAQWIFHQIIEDTGIMPSEIAGMEGLKGSSSVKQLIIRVSDQLRAGEIRLIDTTPKESAAKQRLDEHREKLRERYLKTNKDLPDR